MSYRQIVYTLHEFDLITDEQLEEKLASYDRERAEMGERADAIKAAWKERTPWWKRFWEPNGWTAEFIESEREA